MATRRSPALRMAALAAAAAALLACSTRPRPSPGLLAMERNGKATVRGIVRDAKTGQAVAGITVWGLPRGKDFPWEPPAVTDAGGRFTLKLAAPATYAFLLEKGGISVVTPDPRDPGYVDVVTRPGETIEGIELQFLREKFETPR